MFVTFTKNYTHFIDNIENGFLLREHKVQFKPSTASLIEALLKFWDEYDIKGTVISYIRNLRDTNQGLTNEFWSDLVNKMKTDYKFNANLSLILGQFQSVPIKMKCFTEIRSNQKIDPSHTGYFGEFGILLKEDWLIKSGGCPVIYVCNSMNLTNIMARNLSVMKTLDDCVKLLAKVKSLSIHGAFFDLLSFVETSKHRYEYEWRIVSGHNLGGSSFLPKIERVAFSFKDVHSFYVPDKEARTKFIKFLKKYKVNGVKLPKVLLTKDILLSKKEIERIKKIKGR